MEKPPFLDIENLHQIKGSICVTCPLLDFIAFCSTHKAFPLVEVVVEEEVVEEEVIIARAQIKS